MSPAELHLLRRVDDLEALVRQVLHHVQPDQLTPPERGLIAAVHSVVGTSPFATSELVELAASPLRPELLAALIGVVGRIDAQRVGQALAAIVKRGGRAGALRLVTPTSERGVRLWAVEG
jgi:GAF domain-containing protein